MGWGNCGTDSKGRNIGYCHAARCDHPGCRAKIDRGLAYSCGGMHGTTHLGGDDALDGFDLCCEGYFCPEHLRFPCFEHEDGSDLYAPQLCFGCSERAEIAYRTDPEWRSRMSAGTAETRSGSGLQPASPVGEAETPKGSPPKGGDL
jgi:hypothetical protein